MPNMLSSVQRFLQQTCCSWHMNKINLLMPHFVDFVILLVLSAAGRADVTNADLPQLAVQHEHLACALADPCARPELARDDVGRPVLPALDVGRPEHLQPSHPPPAAACRRLPPAVPPTVSPAVSPHHQRAGCPSSSRCCHPLHAAHLFSLPILFMPPILFTLPILLLLLLILPSPAAPPRLPPAAVPPPCPTSPRPTSLPPLHPPPQLAPHLRHRPTHDPSLQPTRRHSLARHQPPQPHPAHAAASQPSQPASRVSRPATQPASRASQPAELANQPRDQPPSRTQPAKLATQPAHWPPQQSGRQQHSTSLADHSGAATHTLHRIPSPHGVGGGVEGGRWS